MDNHKEASQNKKYRQVGPYLLMHVIGKGAYSIVYEAKKEGEKKRYAIKQISLGSVRPKQLERIHLQIKVLTLIKHHNIVCLLDYKQTSRNLYLVFEYCRHTDLQTYVKKYCKGNMPEEKVRKIAIQIKNAFQVLRANKVVHRDLKLANILVTEDFQIKIADFGFAKHLDDNEFFKSYVGTPLTMAPEIMENRNYNEKCDLWSLGIMLYDLLFGKNPFFTQDRMTKQELKNATKAELKLPSKISEECEDLLRRLIVRQPADRISFEQFFRHPWLSELNSSNNLNEDLLEQALRAELKKILLVTPRKRQQKQFLQSKCEDLLAYELIEHMKTAIENKIMFWINLGKKVLSMTSYPNKKLCYLAIALLIQNLERYQLCSFMVTANETRRVMFGRYEDVRKLLKWGMQEYSKRLPGFIERSVAKMKLFIKQTQFIMTLFDKAELDTRIQQLFLLQLVSEIVKNVEDKAMHDDLVVFIKIKPFSSAQHSLRISSPIFNENTIDMLLKKMQLNIADNKMYKKCGNVFKIDVLYEQKIIEERIYQNIKNLLE